MQPTSDSSQQPEASIRRRLIGFFMFPIAFFPFFALFTYNWRDVPELCMPPSETTSNLIGAVGNYFAYAGYQLVGLGIWSVPPVCVFAGIRLAFGKSFHPGRRTLGVALFVFAATCLLQLMGHLPAIAGILHSLNIAPNAGGAVGYLVMTRGLASLISPFGAGVVMACLLVFSIFLTIGFRTIVNALGRLTAWAADRTPGDGELGEVEREQAIDAARAAREEAKAQRIAEKQRIAEEKAARRAAKEAEKEARRREREEERQRKEAERLAREEEARAIRERMMTELTPPPGAGGTVDWMPARGEAAPQVSAGVPSIPAAPAAPAAPAMRPVRTVNAPVVQQPSAPAPQAAQATAAPVAEAPEDKGPYVLPPVSLLNEVPPKSAGGDENPDAMAQRLVDTLKVFDVNATLAYYVAGPVVTQYALSLDLGTRVERVASLSRNLQMSLQATSLRIEAPIPGKNAVGIEVPNTKPASVCFREIIDGDLWKKNSPGKFQVPLLLGKDAAGNDLVADLAKLPHLLVAGATGQGKSVCLNSIINGLLMCRTPDQLKLIMVDPKRVEFTSYNRLPHLLVPIINDTKKVVFALRSAVVEMDRRLKMFSRANCRNIVDFNNRKTVVQPDMLGGGDELVGDPDMPRTVPYIVIIIDEVADVMQAAKKEVEPVIARLTALARATGIHLILATQRPDANIITGVIKSNIPGRIAFKTSSSIDSRTILDATGSELLIGKGDMLFRMSDGRLLRAQGSFISDEEIGRIVDFIGEHSTVQFDEKLTKRMERIKEADIEDELDGGEEDEEGGEQPAPEPRGAVVGGIPPPAGMSLSKEETLYRNALEVLRDTKRASISHFQRRMGIGYNHAARIVDLLEERGVIGAAKSGAGPREILLDPEALLNEMDGGGAPAAAPDQGAMPADGTGEDDPFGFPSEG